MLPPRFVYRHYVIVRHQDNGSGAAFSFPVKQHARVGDAHGRAHRMYAGVQFPQLLTEALKLCFIKLFRIIIGHRRDAHQLRQALCSPLCVHGDGRGRRPSPRLRFEPGRTDAQHGAQRQHGRKYEPADHKNSSVLLDMACFHHTTSRQKKEADAPWDVRFACGFKTRSFSRYKRAGPRSSHAPAAWCRGRARSHSRRRPSCRRPRSQSRW